MEETTPFRKIAPVVHKHSLHDEKGAIAREREYWLSKTPEERLEALEHLREQYIQLHYETRPEFQRVYRIIKRTPR
jgi:hypothetical protein